MSYALGKNSIQRLNSCHPDIQAVVKEAIRHTQVDFGVAEGHRPVARQQKLYAQGRTAPGKIVTYVDGKERVGKHNLQPSMAIDLYAWVGGKALWDERYLTYLAGVLTATAERLYQAGAIKHRWHWGGNWDRDGVIVDDQKFIDYPHHELR